MLFFFRTLELWRTMLVFSLWVNLFLGFTSTLWKVEGITIDLAMEGFTVRPRNRAPMHVITGATIMLRLPVQTTIWKENGWPAATA